MAKATKKVTTKKSTTTKQQGSFLENPSIVHACIYFPFFIGPIAMYFLGNTDKKKAMHHIKYSVLMAIAATVLIILLKGFFASLVSLAYWGVSIYFAFKAYKGEKIQVEILDTIEDKISETVKK